MSSQSAPRPNRTRPKYEKVAEALRSRVAGLDPHDPLPTERELLDEYSVSRSTIRQAIALLQRKGLIYNVQGSGTYVADPAVVAKTLRLTSFSEDMRQRGLRPSSQVLETAEVAASPQLADIFGVPAGTTLLVLHRLRLANDAPMALEHIHLIRDVLGGVDLDPTRSLYDQLSTNGVVIDRATQTVEAVNLDPREAKLLDQPVAAAALKVSRLTYTDRGQAIERAETIYRGDRYSFDFAIGALL